MLTTHRLAYLCCQCDASLDMKLEARLRGPVQADRTSIFFGGKVYFGKNLVPMSFKMTKLRLMFVELIFYSPNVANLGYWKIGPTIAF